MAADLCELGLMGTRLGRSPKLTPPCSPKLTPIACVAGTTVDVARLAATMDKLSTAAVRFEARITVDEAPALSVAHGLLGQAAIVRVERTIRKACPQPLGQLAMTTARWRKARGPVDHTTTVSTTTMWD
jgi:hypothetical protein